VLKPKRTQWKRVSFPSFINKNRVCFLCSIHSGKLQRIFALQSKILGFKNLQNLLVNIYTSVGVSRWTIGTCHRNETLRNILFPHALCLFTLWRKRLIHKPVNLPFHRKSGFYVEPSRFHTTWIFKFGPILIKQWTSDINTLHGNFCYKWQTYKRWLELDFRQGIPCTKNFTPY